MTGVRAPLNSQEFIRWIAFYRIENARRKKAQQEQRG
jgi:hypothetical protein